MEIPYKIHYKRNICYAHILKTPPCDVLHGHEARIEVLIQSNELDQARMVINFHHLKAIIGVYDHVTLINRDHLVDMVGSNKENLLFKINVRDYMLPASNVVLLEDEPTVEYLSSLLYNQVKSAVVTNLRVNQEDIQVQVTMWETENGGCTYGD